MVLMSRQDDWGWGLDLTRGESDAVSDAGPARRHGGGQQPWCRIDVDRVSSGSIVLGVLASQRDSCVLSSRAIDPASRQPVRASGIATSRDRHPGRSHDWVEP